MKSELTELSEEEIYTALYSDCLTGVLNRRAFDNSYSRFVAIVDLDSLKYFNDQLGHRTGDAQLCKLARRLDATFGRNNVYRIGGDEFAVRGDSIIRILELLKRLRSSFPGFSFGIGKDLITADERLRKEKKKRENNGLRAKRGDAPSWFIHKRG